VCGRDKGLPGYRLSGRDIVGTNQDTVRSFGATPIFHDGSLNLVTGKILPRRKNKINLLGY